MGLMTSEGTRINQTEWLRRLTPVELERLNMFPDNTQKAQRMVREPLYG